VSEGVALGVIVGVALAVALGVSEGVALAVALGVREGVTLAVVLTVTVWVLVGLGVVVGAREGVALAVSEGLAVGLELATRVCVGVGVGVKRRNVGSTTGGNPVERSVGRCRGVAAGSCAATIGSQTAPKTNRLNQIQSTVFTSSNYTMSLPRMRQHGIIRGRFWVRGLAYFETADRMCSKF